MISTKSITAGKELAMTEKDPSRIEVLKKIDELEKQGIFDKDVEEDPPTIPIQPGTVDYCQKKLSTRIKSRYTFHLARKFLNKAIRNGQIIVKDVIGIEHLNEVNSGAVLTCNHFSAFDSFLTQIVYEKSFQHKKRKLFRVIREGNYTNFPGFYGKLMRNCNTLPLSANPQTMKEFLKGAQYQLHQGHYVLIYPEQSMWWNYRKPKPLKSGAFTIAASARVPVVPIFICMEDTDHVEDDGFPIQAYTIFVGKAIYPNLKESISENKAYMADENYRQWKEIYESFYHIPLHYSCEN